MRTKNHFEELSLWDQKILSQDMCWLILMVLTNCKWLLLVNQNIQGASGQVLLLFHISQNWMHGQILALFVSGSLIYFYQKWGWKHQRMWFFSCTVVVHMGAAYKTQMVKSKFWPSYLTRLHCINQWIWEQFLHGNRTSGRFWSIAFYLI